METLENRTLLSGCLDCIGPCMLPGLGGALTLLLTFPVTYYTGGYVCTLVADDGCTIEECIKGDCGREAATVGWTVTAIESVAMTACTMGISYGMLTNP